VTQFNQYLLQHANFDFATFADLTNFCSVTAVNTSPFTLGKNDAKNNPQRATMTRKPYVFDGDFSQRFELTSAAVAGNLVVRNPLASANAPIVRAGDKLSLVVAARCSVNGNALLVRVVGMLAAVDTLFLEPVGNADAIALNYRHNGNGGFTWNTSTRDIQVTMQDGWRTYGFELTIPPGINRVACRVQNGTAGAQTIDLGAFYLREQNRVKVA
jgi:hypothetical protein